jgi:hypothetical protein
LFIMDGLTTSETRCLAFDVSFLSEAESSPQHLTSEDFP